MAEPRKPQDRKPKAITPDPNQPFSFTHNRQTFELAPAGEVLTAGFARQNRHKTLEDQLFTMLEALADEDALAAIDDMKREEFQQFQEDFYAHNGISLGE